MEKTCPQTHSPIPPFFQCFRLCNAASFDQIYPLSANFDFEKEVFDHLKF